MTNTQPSYYTTPYFVPPGLGNPKPVPGRFNVWEYRNGEATKMFDLSNRCPDLFNQILKRGIPEPGARNVFYEMTA